MELRRDYILDKWVIIAERRGARPHEFHRPESSNAAASTAGTATTPATPATGAAAATGATAASLKQCFFCPGNEHLTPAEIDRYPRDGQWQIRVFPNKFPFAERQGQAAIRTDNTFFTFAQPYGQHEILVETAQHNRQLWDLDQHELTAVFSMYMRRMAALYELPETRYVLVFKNYGKEAGTSLVHSHTQIISLNKIPSTVEEKVKAVKVFGSNPYARIIDIEKSSYRRCFENKHAVAFTPYASRYNYELWLFPKRFVSSLAELSDEELGSMMDLLGPVLSKLKQLDCSFNYFLHNSPPNEKLHFHIEVTPRMAKWGGYELGSDIIVNAVSPETAAAFYRS